MNFSQSAIFSIIASLGLLLINLFIGIIEARVLGPEEIGRFQVYITTQTYIATIFALGIGQSCIYFINALKINERRVLSTSINSSLLLSVFAGLVTFIIILSNQDYFGYDSMASICAFSIGTTATLINNIFTPVLLTKMEVVRNQVVKYSARIITLIILILVLFGNYHLSVGFLIGLTGFTSLLSSFLLFFYFHRRFSFRDKIDVPLLGRITSYGLKLSGNNIASITLSSLPVYFLTWFSTSDGMTNVGYYGRANTLLVIGTIISSSIGPLLYSKWSGTEADKLKNEVRRISMMYFTTNIILALALILAAPILIKILYGPDYSYAIRILQVLALSLVANGIKEICYGVLSSQGFPLRILKNLVWGIIICALGNFWMIPNYGGVGCAWVTSVVSFITAFMLMIDVTRVSKINLIDFFIIPSRDELMYIIKQVFRKA